MRVFRTTITLLIAVSIGLLPIAAGAVFAPKLSAASVSEPMADCCPHASTCDKKAVDKKMFDDCATMAACTLKCFNYVPAVSFLPTDVPVVTSDLPLLESGVLRSQIGNPPFRPPRI